MLNPKSLLNVLPAVLLSFVQVVGMGEVARSQVIVQPQNQQTIIQLLQQLHQEENNRKREEGTIERNRPANKETIIKRLAAIGKPTIPHLMPWLKGKNQDQQRLAVQILKEMGVAALPAVPHLIPLLQDPISSIPGIADNNYYQQFGVVEILVNIGSPAIPSLLPSLKDSNAGVRRNIAKALGKIGADTMPSLIPLLKSSDQREQIGALIALQQMESAAKPALPEILPLVENTTPVVRSHAAYTLGLIGKPAKTAIPSLLKLLNDPKAGVRQSAIWAIGSIGGSLEAISSSNSLLLSITGLLSDPTFSRVRLAATQTLGRLDPSEKSVMLLKLQLNDSNLHVRQSAAQALGEMGSFGQSAIPSLISTLKKDPRLHVRAAAAQALGKLGGSPQQTIPALIKGLKDDYSEVRYESAIALGNFGESAQSAIPDLVIFLKQPGGNKFSTDEILSLQDLLTPEEADESSISSDLSWSSLIGPRTVNAASFALGKIGKPAIPALLSILQEPNRQFQILAIRTLGEIKGLPASTAPSLVPFLKESLEAEAVITTLGSMGKPIIPLMVAIFQQEPIDPFPGPIDQTKPNQQPINQQGNPITPQDRQREYGIISMEQIIQESNAAAVIAKVAASDLNVIRPLMLHQDARVREGAAQALGKVPESNSTLTSEVLSMLTILLKDPELDVRWQATQSLRWMKDKAAPAIPALLPLLKDSPKGLDLPGAAYALSHIGEHSIPFLIPLLKDQDLHLRTIAKKTLMYMPLAETSAAAGIPDLLRLLKDRDPTVRSSAAEIIGSIGEPAKAAIPSLLPLLKDRDPSVRSTAAEALKNLGYQP
jgi:HEAT repeat protein